MIRLCLIMLTISLSASNIRISEVMANPQGSEYENEFVELYNYSEHVMYINGWVLSDGTGVDTLMHWSGPTGIPPFGYAVILDPSYNFASGPYHDIMPDSTPLYTISTDATLGSGGLSNSAESVIIRSPDTSMVSWMSWSRATDNGYSWERVSVDDVDSLAQWEQSLVENGTPGYRNSRALPIYNLKLEQLEVIPLAGSQAFDLKLIIRNTGSSVISQARLAVQVFEHDELLNNREETLPELSSGDSLVWSNPVQLNRCGWIHLVVEIHLPQDEFPEDNRIDLETYVTCLNSPLILNEIMPLPLTDAAEWVEIYNRSDQDVDLRGWQLSDDHLTGKPVTDSSLVLHSNAYVILSNQSRINGCPWDCVVLNVPGFPTLNNSGDVVILTDPLGIRMDDMFYDETSALAEGRSWERINSNKTGTDPRNWGTCINAAGSTPGYRNSLHLTELSPELMLELEPNPFTPNGDGSKDVLTIYYELPFEQALMSVIIFDMAGRKIAEPVQVQAVAHRGQIIWDGTASYGGIAVTGLYICKLFIDDLQGHVREELRKIYLLR